MGTSILGAILAHELWPPPPLTSPHTMLSELGNICGRRNPRRPSEADGIWRMLAGAKIGQIGGGA